ncbi:MAG TPA: hypothetical protein VKR58_01150 [Aquella sp.]|nr:hypothetical protein [Aquella sp.]
MKNFNTCLFRLFCALILCMGLAWSDQSGVFYISDKESKFVNFFYHDPIHIPNKLIKITWEENDGKFETTATLIFPNDKGAPKIDTYTDNEVKATVDNNAQTTTLTGRFENKESKKLRYKIVTFPNNMPTHINYEFAFKSGTECIIHIKGRAVNNENEAEIGNITPPTVSNKDTCVLL